MPERLDIDPRELACSLGELIGRADLDRGQPRTEGDVRLLASLLWRSGSLVQGYAPAILRDEMWHGYRNAELRYRPTTTTPNEENDDA